MLKQFHRDTVHLVSNTSNNTRDNIVEQRNDKEYSDDWDSITLNYKPKVDSEFEEVLKSRRTSWDFSNSVDFDKLSSLLSLAFNVTEVKVFNGTQVSLRAYPSAGAAYSISIYIYVNHVDPEMDRTIFKYEPEKQTLYKIKKADSTIINNLTASTRYKVQDFSNAKIIFFLCTDFTKLFSRYGLLTYRLSLLEAGHMAHNLQLVSTYLGLNSVAIGGFYDLEVEKAITEDENCLYINAIG